MYRDYEDIEQYSRGQLVKDLNEAHGKIRSLKLWIKIIACTNAALWGVVLMFLKMWFEKQ